METYQLPIRAQDGSVTALLGITREITDRIQTEGLLRLQRQGLHEVALGAPISHSLAQLCHLLEDLVSDAHATVFLVNSAVDQVNAVEQVNLHAGPSLPQGLRDQWQQVDVKEGNGASATVVARNQRVIATDVEKDASCANVRDVAKEYGIRAAWSYPIRVEGGQLVGTIGLTMGESRAPTEFQMQVLGTAANLAGIAIAKKREEDDLRFTQFSVDNNPTEILWINPNGNFFYVNQAAADSLGYTVEELRSMHITDIATDVTRELWPDWWEKSKSEKMLQFETRHKHRLGISKPVDVMVNFMRHKQQEFIVAFVQDMTERKRTEEKLDEQRAELAHVARLSTMGEMATDIAHELNQPLTAIANLAFANEQFLAADEPPDLDSLRDASSQLREQAVRAGDIVRRLRSFVKKVEPQRAVSGINKIVKEAIQLLDCDLRSSGIHRHERLEANLPLILADGIQIQQVLVNLVRNSIDSMAGVPRGRRQLQIHTQRLSNNYVEVSVEDTGVGLSDEDLGSMFQGFYSTKEQGMGMGLAISRSIVEAHSGRLVAERASSGGAIFRVRLPIHSP